MKLLFYLNFSDGPTMFEDKGFFQLRLLLEPKPPFCIALNIEDK